MDVSKFLSKVIGLYFIIITTAMFVNMPQFINNVEQLIHDAPLMFVTGFFTLILGLLMVVAHSVWQWNWRVMVTLIAWITLIKGSTILFFPQLMDTTTMVFLRSASIQYMAAGFDFILGVLFCYFGFKHEE